MEQVTTFLKNNYIKIILGVALILFSFRGLQGFWSDFTENIYQSKLKEQGINLVKEERIVIQDLEEASIETEEAVKEVKKVDYQTYKHEKAKQKGIIITDNDVKRIKSADSLLSKWKSKK